MMINEERVFYNPGDIVKLKHDLENVPTMYVVEKVTRNIMDKDGGKESIFIGIKCRWFDKNQILHEAIFSTKDLIHI